MAFLCDSKSGNTLPSKSRPRLWFPLTCSGKSTAPHFSQELRGNIRVLCRCRPRTHHDKGGGVCVSFPGDATIEMVNERGKRKAWAFDQVKRATLVANYQRRQSSVRPSFDARRLFTRSGRSMDVFEAIRGRDVLMCGHASLDMKSSILSTYRLGRGRNPSSDLGPFLDTNLFPLHNNPSLVPKQVFGLEARQETVYAEVSPLVVSVLDGYNACIFAYGQVTEIAGAARHSSGSNEPATHSYNCSLACSLWPDFGRIRRCLWVSFRRKEDNILKNCTSVTGHLCSVAISAL